MGSLLSFVVRGRAQAAFIATACLLLPLTSFVSGAVVALVTLRFGAAEGALVLAITAASGAVLTWFAFGDIQGVMSFALTMGAPLVLLAAVLRATSSQGAMLSAAGVLGAVAIGVLHLGTNDPVRWWRALLERLVVDRVRRESPDIGAAEIAQVAEAMDFYAWMMSILAVAWFVLAVVLVLFLARWGQGFLDNPGGFGREFRALRLDRRVSYASIVVAALALVASDWAGGMPAALLCLMVMLHWVQGMSIVHWLVAVRGLGSAWLPAVYVALVFVPVIIVPLAVTGISDSWMDWRSRFGRPGTSDE